MRAREPTARPSRFWQKGLDPWKSAGGVAFCRWDLWYLALAHADFAGDGQALRRVLEDRRRPVGLEAEDTEAKLSHLDDVLARVERSGLRPADLLGDALRDRRVLYKARDKILRQWIDREDATEAMRWTPRRKLAARALRGYWPCFPVSPGGFEDLFRDPSSEKGDPRRRGSAIVARRLRARFDREEKRPMKDATRLALVRAYLTALLEAVPRVGDRSGFLSGAFGEALKPYGAIPWASVGLEAEVYYRDLVEMVAWDEYSFFDGHLAPFFDGVAEEHWALLDRIVRETVDELARHRLVYQAERALDHVLVAFSVRRRRFDRFVALALEIGSDRWVSITAMAEAAVGARDPDLALAVFAAADRPGRHRDHLRNRCLQLTGRPSPSAPLRLLRG